MAADLRITMPDDLLKALREETARLDMRVSTFVSGLIADALHDEQEINAEDTPLIDKKVYRLRVARDDYEYIKQMSKELNIAPRQYISKLIRDNNTKAVNITFLEDFMDEFRAMERHIRRICYLASRDDNQQVSEQLIRETLTKLDELIELFCQIYKELIRTKRSIIRNIEKGGK